MGAILHTMEGVSNNRSTQMDTDDMSMEEQEITVRLPRNLVQRLQKNVRPNDRDRFIRDALEQQLSLEEQFAALEETAASWLLDEEQVDTSPSDEDEILSWLNDLGRSESQSRRP